MCDDDKDDICGIHDGDDFCCIATQMGGWGDDSWENDTEWDDAGGIERYRHHIQHHHHHRHHVFLPLFPHNFLAQKGQSRVWGRCFGAKIQFLFEMV